MTNEKKVRSKKKKKEKFKIQTIEEYVIDYNIPIPTPTLNIGKWPDLFSIKLDNEKKDDIVSIVPVLESSPGVSLYASLLVADSEEREKKQKETSE